MSDILVMLITRRDQLEERFLYYSAPDKAAGNMAALGDMALVLGRLDVMIRREYAAMRRTTRT